MPSSSIDRWQRSSTRRSLHAIKLRRTAAINRDDGDQIEVIVGEQTKRKSRTMILEIATLTVQSGMDAEFEAGVAKAVSAFRTAQGCHGMELQRSHETPGRYLLFVRWDSVEAHTVGFRGSPQFQEWRACVSHCFAAPPQVEHVASVWHGFGGTVAG